MAVLVTGGCGYLGDHLVLALREQGREVVVIDRAVGRYPVSQDGVKYVRADITDRAALESIFKTTQIEQVAHLAASIDVAESIANPEKYERDNVEGTRRLVECCVRFGVREFLFASTAAVYGDFNGSAISEDTLCQPKSPYGTTKLKAERYLLEVAQERDFRPLIYRHFNAAGADRLGRSGPRGPNPSDLIRSACRTALGLRERLTVYGNTFSTPDGTCVRDFIHVSDVSIAQTMGLDYLRDGGAPAVFNIGSGIARSVNEVIAIVRALIAPQDFHVHQAEPRSGEIIMSVADCQRIADEIGWIPTRSDLTIILENALGWEKYLADQAEPKPEAMQLA